MRLCLLYRENMPSAVLVGFVTRLATTRKNGTFHHLFIHIYIVVAWIYAIKCKKKAYLWKILLQQQQIRMHNFSHNFWRLPRFVRTRENVFMLLSAKLHMQSSKSMTKRIRWLIGRNMTLLLLIWIPCPSHIEQYLTHTHIHPLHIITQTMTRSFNFCFPQ